MNLVNYGTSSYSTAQNNLLKNLLTLSTGKAINSAADNPAGSAQSTSYNVQLSSTAQAMNNIQDGLSLTDVAGGASASIIDDLQNLNTLSVRAGNGILNANDRTILQSQANQLTQNIDQTAAKTQFNGQNLLNSNTNVTIQAGANADQTQNIALGNLSSAALGVSGLNVTTPAGQSSALSSINNALQTVSNQNATIGANAASLNAAFANQGTFYNNLAATNSRISDTDYATATANLSQNTALSKTALKAIAAYNSIQGNLSLLFPSK